MSPSKSASLWLRVTHAAGGPTAQTRVTTPNAQLIERLGKPVTIVPCSPLNIKITTRDDLKLAEQVLKVLPKPKLEGFQHPFAGDDLWR